MKKYLLISTMFVAPLVFAGCNLNKTNVTSPVMENAADQQQVQEISGSSSDEDAAQAAIDATDQALDELDSIDFGEAPAIE